MAEHIAPPLFISDRGDIFMKIVFLETDTLGEDMNFDRFNELGQVTLYRRSSPADNHLRITDADIIVVNKIPVNESLLKHAPNVRFIAASATGTNNIDFTYTNSRNIKVANARGYSTDSVAQHTFAMLFYLYEKLYAYDNFVKDGRYSDYPMFSCFVPYFNELANKTWGIIGLGTIGRKVADIAGAFGCNVIYYSTSGKNISSDYARCDYEELLNKSDIISVHCPLNKDTLGLIDSHSFDMMKPSAILLNLARGPIIDEDALYSAITNEKIAGAGLDVLCTEPIPKSSNLLKIKDSTRLLITPHMAWGTREARARCLDEVYYNIKAFINGKERNIVRE